MEKQHGVYCSENEWLGVMAAVSRGMIAMHKDTDAGDKDSARMLPWAGAACSSFQKRVMEELGMHKIYDAWLAGNHDAAKALADKYADGIKATQR